MNVCTCVYVCMCVCLLSARLTCEPQRLQVLQKSAERRDTGAGSNQDERDTQIGRQTECVRRQSAWKECEGVRGVWR